MRQPLYVSYESRDGSVLSLPLSCLFGACRRAMTYVFDHVFGGHASQEDVFREVSGFVQSALDGFKVGKGW